MSFQPGSPGTSSRTALAIRSGIAMTRTLLVTDFGVPGASVLPFPRWRSRPAHIEVDGNHTCGAGLPSTIPAGRPRASASIAVPEVKPVVVTRAHRSCPYVRPDVL
jgi:hypothetical protein